MKKAIQFTAVLIFIGMVVIGCETKQKTAKTPAMMQVSGHIEWNQNYCGGPQPSQEMLDKLRTPKPLEGHTFYIKKGSSNQLESALVTQVITDAEGNFSTELPPGEYVFLMKEQLNQDIMTTPGENIKVANEEKLMLWWRKGLARINSSNKVVSLKLRKACYLPLGVPYLRYTGPIAP